MINKELNFNIAGVRFNVFMQDSFFKHKSRASPLHKHKYPEVHICALGNSEIFTDGKTVTIKEGEMLIIPDETYHRTKTEYGVERISFQVTLPNSEMKIIRLSKHQMQGIFEEIENFNRVGNCTRLSGALSDVLSSLIENPPEKIHDITDRSFLIHEFFLYNYANQINLSDLAKELNLSTKQASRSVKSCLGTTFKEELTRRRMEAAVYLRNTTDFSLQEIASAVGYLSYSGFWKAFNLYNKE